MVKVKKRKEKKKKSVYTEKICGQKLQPSHKFKDIFVKYKNINYYSSF